MQPKPDLTRRTRAGGLWRSIAIVIPLGLTACADTLTSEQATSSATLQRQYDGTLTKSEQQAVISDLQSATAKQPDGEAKN